MTFPSSGSRDGSLTSGQQQALAAFATWLQAPSDGTPFVLSGFAGTGKTFLSMHLLAQVEATGLCWTVVAPTHKAVGVLRQQLALHGLQPTWYPATIHRLLRLKLRRERDLERCEETEQTAMALEHLGLVLIDEASMVDSSLLEISLRCAHPFRTRLVFVGDPAQLPPVGEPVSPVFALGRAEKAFLSEVVRHQGPVLRLATGLREGALPCRQPPVLARCAAAWAWWRWRPGQTGWRRPRRPCAGRPSWTTRTTPASSATPTAPSSSSCPWPAGRSMERWRTSCLCCRGRC